MKSTPWFDAAQELVQTLQDANDPFFTNRDELVAEALVKAERLLQQPPKNELKKASKTKTKKVSAKFDDEALAVKVQARMAGNYHSRLIYVDIDTF